MNHTTDYLEIIGPEPDISDYRDLHRWDKWGVWFRRFSKLAPFSNGTVDEDGTAEAELVDAGVGEIRADGR